MIQRIQSLFLLATVVLMSFVLFVPISELTLKTREKLSYFSYGVILMGPDKTLIHHTFPIAVLVSAIIIIAVITIFIYNKRILQMRLCVYNILLLIFLVGIMIFYHFNIRNHLDITNNSYSFIAIFPIVCIILVFQAFRAIRHDDLLIKSYDRLR